MLDDARGSAAGSPSGDAALLRIAGLSKSFPGLKALDDVSLEIRSGEVVSIVGQNGSGKSTLVKVLAGVYAADSGGVIEHRDLRFIHQDLGLVATLSTIENLDIGRRAPAWGLRPSPRRSERQAAEQAVRRFGGDFDVRTPVGRLSAAERTIVAISRAMRDWSPPDGVLVLDEPTAALGGEEVGRLFEAVRRVAEQGAGVLFISHRLDEVLGLSDRVIALRDGRVVATGDAGQVDHDWLVNAIAGRVLSTHRPHRQPPGADVALRVEKLSTDVLHDVDLRLRTGEVVGVSGLLGSGREQLAEAIFGATRRHGGSIVVSERTVPADQPRASIDNGVAFVPADRARYGAVMSLTARENLTLPQLRSLRRTFGRLDRAAENRETREWVDRVELHPALPDRPLRLFSGGNQQKVVMARWLRIMPKVLLLDEPTQGVDVGAKAAIYDLIDTAAAAGTAVLVASSDAAELLSICDRVLVLRHGRVAAELPRDEFSEARLLSESFDPAPSSPPIPLSTSSR
jgi:ABC-type sugar transport system ATPase subunit